MLRITISREEAIPYVDENGNIMQMIRKKLFVSVTNENDETEDELKTKLDILFDGELEKALSSDDIYQKLKTQRDLLFEEIKKVLPKDKMKELITKLK